MMSIQALWELLGYELDVGVLLWWSHHKPPYTLTFTAIPKVPQFSYPNVWDDGLVFSISPIQVHTFFGSLVYAIGIMGFYKLIILSPFSFLRERLIENHFEP
jgi:hypothetical protein